MKRLITRHAVEVLEGFFESWAQHRTRLESFVAFHLASRKSIEFREKQIITEDVMDAVRNWRLLCHLAKSDTPRAVYERSRRAGVDAARRESTLPTSTCLSVDRELLRHLEESMGREAAADALEAQCRPVAVTGRTNPGRISRSELLRLFIQKYRFSVRKCPRTDQGFAFLSPPHVVSTDVSARAA